MDEYLLFFIILLCIISFILFIRLFLLNIKLNISNCEDIILYKKFIRSSNFLIGSIAFGVAVILFQMVF